MAIKHYKLVVRINVAEVDPKDAWRYSNDGLALEESRMFIANGGLDEIAKVVGPIFAATREVGEPLPHDKR